VWKRHVDEVLRALDSFARALTPVEEVE